MVFSEFDFSVRRVLIQRYRIDKKDDRNVRKILTQLTVFKQLWIILVTVIIISVALLHFESVRHLGTGLLTSVGVVGIIIGLAAQKNRGSFISWYSNCYFLPIQLNDVVIVENQWGMIEEINFYLCCCKIMGFSPPHRSN